MNIEEVRQGKKRIIGTMVRMIRDSGVAQVAGHAGLDFIMLDMEHGAYSVETFAEVAKVARSIGIGIFVRVPELSKGYVSGLMDAGAEGVMVPMISTEEEARKLAGWAKFPPQGVRGFGSAAVYNGFGGPDGDVNAFMERQNRNTLAIAQIETKEAVDNIEKIAAVDGIDLLLIGPNDLAISLGVPGDVNGELCRAAISKVRDTAKKHHKMFSIHAGEGVLKHWNPEDMEIVMSELDINVLRNGFAEIAKRYK